MQTEHIIQIGKHIREKANCQMTLGPGLGGPTAILSFDDLPQKTQYSIVFFDADKGGTLGLKIRWVLGKVTKLEDAWQCLILNERALLDHGPLYAAIIPKEDFFLFALVGQMLFHAKTTAEEIASLWFNQAFLNYLFFDMSVAGVQKF